jgi:hypothetical protein
MDKEEQLRRLLQQAMIDEQFRLTLIENPLATLKEWGFGEEEAAVLSSLLEQGGPAEGIELDQRVSKTAIDPEFLFGGGGPGG